MKTQRLELRELTPELSAEVLSQGTEEQLKFLGMQDPGLLEETLVKLEKRANNEYPGSRKWHLIETSSGLVIGSAGFHAWMLDHKKAELGYILNEEYRSQGFMTEALKPIIEFGFDQLELHRIEAFADPENRPSVRILERLGFTLEGRLREHYHTKDKIHDSFVYSLLKSEFTNFQ